ncbi:MAG: MBL fold metallo-hydrolase [Coriobacteriia bacterium]|nr:MBL fold metallo-hydrolase [Coriobacteriia bacterium]
MSPAVKIPRDAQPLAGDTRYVPGLTNAGFVLGLAIDTSPDESVYEGIGVDRLGITHGHADHFSAGAFIRDMGASVWAARDDATLIENPEVNIRGMFSWAKPSDLLITRLFRGEPCKVDGYLEDWDDPRATVVPLPGHTLGHCGFLTRDGVLFSGDALYLEELWERHPLPYAIDPDLVVASLEAIAGMEYEWLVPAHGHPVSQADSLRHIEHHIRQIKGIEALVLQLLDQARTTEEIIALISADRCLSDNPAQYWLAVTTVKGFLGGLLAKGSIEFYVKGHSGWWHAL